jgi:hypothetical protein
LGNFGWRIGRFNSPGFFLVVLLEAVNIAVSSLAFFNMRSIESLPALQVSPARSSQNPLLSQLPYIIG